MKKVFVGLVAMMFLFVPMAFAIPLTLTIEEGSIDVGAPDFFTEDTYSPGGPGGASPTVELKFINDSLNMTYSMDSFYKFDNLDKVSPFPLVTTSDPSYTAFDFGSYRPDYFVLFQAGIGYLYENLDNLRYAVTTFKDVSHISIVGGRVPVPEPSTLLLFGAGIAGLAMYRRKRS